MALTVDFALIERRGTKCQDANVMTRDSEIGCRRVFEALDYV